MTRVYLLRHGATAANQATPYRLQGRGSDLSLDDAGQDQARRAASALSSIGITSVYASPLRRAMETAMFLGVAQGPAPIALKDLVECDVGRWEGLTWEQAREADPEEYERFHAEPGLVPYPGGESFLDVKNRVDPAIAELAARHRGESIAVVGHNVVNRAYLSGLLGIPINQARSIRQSNGGINLVIFENGRAWVETLNSRLHLDASAISSGA